jgi:hypothetical protein
MNISFGRSKVVELGVTLSALIMPVAGASAQQEGAGIRREDEKTKLVSFDPARKIADIVCAELQKVAPTGLKTRALPSPLTLADEKVPVHNDTKSCLQLWADYGRRGAVLWMSPQVPEGQEGVQQANFPARECKVFRSSFDPLSDSNLKLLSVGLGCRDVECEDGLDVLGIGLDNEVGFELKRFLVEAGASDVQHHVTWAIVNTDGEQRRGEPKRIELIDVPNLSGQFVVKNTISWSAHPGAEERASVTFIHCCRVDPLTDPFWLDPRPVATFIADAIEARSSAEHDRAIAAALPGIWAQADVLEGWRHDLFIAQLLNKGREVPTLSYDEFKVRLTKALKTWAYGLAEADLPVISYYLEERRRDSNSLENPKVFKEAGERAQQWQGLLKRVEGRTPGFRDVVVPWHEVPFSLPWPEVLNALIVAELSR